MTPLVGRDIEVSLLHEQYLRCGMRSRDDTAQMRKYDPGFVKLKPRY